MTSTVSRQPHLITLAICVGLSALTLNSIVPSLPTIADEFDVSYAVANLAVAGYLGVTAIMQLIMGPLSDRYGRRPVLLIAIVVYLLGSLLSLVSGDIVVFLAGRVLQAASITGYALSMAIIRDTNEPQDAASRIGYVAAGMALGPMLGPVLGGVLEESFGWRAIFIVYSVLGVALIALIWVDVNETNRTRSSTLGEQIRAYPELFGSRRFWGYALCAAFSIATFFCFTSGAPLVGRELFDLTPSAIGIAMGSITFGFLIGNLITGRIAKRTRLSTMMITGRIAALLGMFVSLGILAAGMTHPISFFAPLILMGFGNGLTLPNTNTGVVSVRPKLAGSAAGLAGALVVGTGALMTSVTGIVVKGPNAALILLGILILCGAFALASALYVRHVDQTEEEHSRS